MASRLSLTTGVAKLQDRSSNPHESACSTPTYIVGPYGAQDPAHNVAVTDGNYRLDSGQVLPWLNQQKIAVVHEALQDMGLASPNIKTSLPRSNNLATGRSSVAVTDPDGRVKMIAIGTGMPGHPHLGSSDLTGRTGIRELSQPPGENTVLYFGGGRSIRQKVLQSTALQSLVATTDSLENPRVYGGAQVHGRTSYGF